MKQRPFLTLQNASFRVGEGLAFEKTNWSFHSDEHWAVLGGNGSGKSLFADCVRGVLPVVQGSLEYHFRRPPGLSAEEVIGHVSFEDRKLELDGSVMQSRWSTIEEEESLSVAGFLSYDRVMNVNPFAVEEDHEQLRSAFARRLERAVGLLRLDPFRDRTLISLSNGERQRVQLAHELAKPLRLLILDEPFTGIDLATRRYLGQVFSALMRTPLRLLLITTHGEELPPGITHVLEVENCRAARLGKVNRHRRAHRPRAPKAQATQSSAPRLITKNTAPVLIDLRDVTVRYGDKTVLHNLDWTVRTGESWAVIGPNGSGKTTLLSLIAGDHPQAYGNHVVVFGLKRGTGESIWDIKRHTGIISPELHLHFDETLTCLDAVVSGFFDTNGLFEEPNQRQLRAARRMLKEFGLTKWAALPLADLSLGEQRMVLLARALVKRPRLLILDEPCQGLDAEHTSKFLKRIADLVRSKATTVLFVTHRPEEIPPGVDRRLVLG